MSTDVQNARAGARSECEGVCRGFYGVGMVDRAARWLVLLGDTGGLEYEWDDLDEGERLVLVEDVFGLAGAQGATQVALLSQLLEGEPPFVWDTLERLLDAGVELGAALGQLRLVLLSTMHDVIGGNDYSDDEYRRRLARLPLPDAGLVEDVLDRLAAGRRVAETDELIETVMAELGGEPDDRMLRMLVERVMEELIIEGFGPLQWLSGGRTVHRRALTDGIVLTHELTDSERDSERLEVDVDLAGFVGLIDPSLADADADDEILMLTDGQWSMSWLGPDGWLDSYPAGSVLAVRVDEDEMVSIEVVDSPAVDPAVAGLLRRVVEEEVDEPGMPVTAADVILGMLAEEPDVFDRPQAPLRQLCEAAGLELRGTEIGDDPELWRNAAQLRRYGRLHERTDDDRELVGAVVGVVDVCERLALGEDIDPGDIATAVESLADLDVMDLVGEELFRADADLAPTPEVFAALADPATSRSLASVHTLAAIGAEYGGELPVAEQHLELAVEADPTHGVAIDRLAWYASDRGTRERRSGCGRSSPVPASSRPWTSFGRSPVPLPGRTGDATSRVGAVRDASTSTVTSASPSLRRCRSGSVGCAARPSSTSSGGDRRRGPRPTTSPSPWLTTTPGTSQRSSTTRSCWT